MILEHALLPVQPGREADFEATFARAREIISASPGFGRLTLSRCLERPSTYLLLVEWDRLEDHTEGFRGSSAYQEWSRLLHPFYDPFPTVEHYRAVDHGPRPAPEVRLVPEGADSPRAAALLADFVASIQARYPAFDPDIGPSARPEDFMAPHGAFFVAEKDGTAVGCCGVKALGPRGGGDQEVVGRPCRAGTRARTPTAPGLRGPCRGHRCHAGPAGHRETAG
jgi:heme-degrading monooxygenase HmoA